jgi:2-hydroxylaminobenzoate mutase
MSIPLLLQALDPILRFLPTLDLTQPDVATEALARQFPLSALEPVRALLRQGVAERWLCDRENGAVRYSRVLKAAASSGPGGSPTAPAPATGLDSIPYSVDAVHMSGPALGHTHPRGEIDLSFAVDPGARFDGHPEGFTVYAPGSWHVPTVTGGAMDILYFLPGGQIRFEEQPGRSAEKPA